MCAAGAGAAAGDAGGGSGGSHGAPAAPALFGGLEGPKLLAYLRRDVAQFLGLPAFAPDGDVGGAAGAAAAAPGAEGGAAPATAPPITAATLPTNVLLLHLGLDSLSLMQLQGKLAAEYGLRLRDEPVFGEDTTLAWIVARARPAQRRRRRSRCSSGDRGRWWRGHERRRGWQRRAGGRVRRRGGRHRRRRRRRRRGGGGSRGAAGAAARSAWKGARRASAAVLLGAQLPVLPVVLRAVSGLSWCGVRWGGVWWVGPCMAQGPGVGWEARRMAWHDDGGRVVPQSHCCSRARVRAASPPGATIARSMEQAGAQGAPLEAALTSSVVHT
jgi:hypothetical protein